MYVAGHFLNVLLFLMITITVGLPAKCTEH